MRRSHQPLYRHSSALANVSTALSLISHRASGSTVHFSSRSYRSPLYRPSGGALSVLLYRPAGPSAAAGCFVFSRPLSTSLPSGGAPTSPSQPSPLPHSPPRPPQHQQQPAVGAHPPHSSAATRAPDAIHASASAGGAADGRLGSHGLSHQPEAAAEEAPPANESRLRRLFRQYGAVAVGSYLVIYVSTLGMLYVAIKERWLGGYDIQHLVDALGLEHYMEHIDPRKGDFAVAWIATKFTEPLRLALTAAITPSVARMLGRAPPKDDRGVRAKVEARIQQGVEKAKDTVEERMSERTKQ